MDLFDHLMLRVLSNIDPSYLVTYLPKLELIELVIFIFGCCGMWLGASVLGFIDTHRNVEVADGKTKRKSIATYKMADKNGDMMIEHLFY